MALKDRKRFQAMNAVREWLLNSDYDLGIGIEASKLQVGVAKIDVSISLEDVIYTTRYLKERGYLNELSNDNFALTVKGMDEWLFPRGISDSQKIFLSHASEDKVLAGKIKREIESTGEWFVFVAHDNIEAGAEWRDRLISELDSCGVFLCLRTKQFDKKQYTEQECGFALALNKRVLALCVGTDPGNMGFLSAIQAKVFPELDPKLIAEYVIKQISIEDTGK
jgi:hypothetical protein